MTKFDFDDHWEDYNSIYQSQLSDYGDVDYFGENKVRLMRRILRNAPVPQRILDFGCGIGRNLPHLRAFFPNSKLFAFDISKKSLAHAASRNRGVVAITEKEIDSHESSFDAIFISGVFHHVDPENRDFTAQRIKRLLTDDGMVFVFEHNPYNPVTRRIVKDCVFDSYAKLITKRELTSLFVRNHLYIKRFSYILFVPPRFRSFAFIEPFLTWLPLGGQYCAVFTKLA